MYIISVSGLARDNNQSILSHSLLPPLSLFHYNVPMFKNIMKPKCPLYYLCKWFEWGFFYSDTNYWPQRWLLFFIHLEAREGFLYIIILQFEFLPFLKILSPSLSFSPCSEKAQQCLTVGYYWSLFSGRKWHWKLVTINRRQTAFCFHKIDGSL